MPGKEQASVVKEEERKKLDMKIEIRDFGPISSGEITLKPLTVFIGPNNSGKSYAAMLIHSLFESYSPTGPLIGGVFFSIRRGFTGGRIPGSTKRFSEVTKQFGNLQEGEELEIPKELLEEITKEIFKEVYQRKLSDEIIYSFACPLLQELVRIGKDSFTLEINYNSCIIHLRSQQDELRIRDYPQLDFKIRIRAIGGHEREPRYVSLRKQKEKNEFSFGMSPGSRLMPLRLRDLVLNICTLRVLEDVTMQCHYLPAARSGILQGHKALAASIVRQSAHAGIERLEIPKFSGVVSDFISSIIDMPEEKGPLYQLAKDFEEQLILGEIMVPSKGEHLYPEIKYRFRDTEIPLHRSSSTVSELAPLFLYLKYKVGPKNILMIEEPEAHLHPRNQRILARLLVRLVREGVNVIITTHSEYLLEQLRNFVLLSKVEPKKRVEKYEYNEEDYLEPDEFAAYLFHYDKKSKGHKIDRVKMTKDGEFSQDEFVNVIDALYEETIRLRIDLSDET